MPALAPDAWKMVQACSGIHAAADQPLDSVKWFAGDLVAMDRTHQLAGLWVPPDTILLDAGAIDDPRVVAHELLHHLLRGPPGDDKHPLFYFVVRCHLFELPVGG
jgi:hypothetical protein